MLDLMVFIFKQYFFSYRHSCKVRQIHSLTYRDYVPSGGTGGSSAVLSCQKKLIGNLSPSGEVKYTYAFKNTSLKNTSSEFSLLGAIRFVKYEIENNRESLFLTHDIRSAFALSIFKVRYSLVYHSQGPTLEEKVNFHLVGSFLSRLAIKAIERRAFKKAQYVCFPSKGAEDYYFQSQYRSVNRNQVRIGPTLYNTLYAADTNVDSSIIEIEENVRYFLSIGQLTVAKGIANVSLLLEEFLKINGDERICYIIVGNGPLKDEIHFKLDQIVLKYPQFNYLHIEKCTYPQISYLQNISSLYLMLHTISIFDLATLEVMSKGKAILLSHTGGNKEYDKNNNILFYRDSYPEAAKLMLNSNFHILGQKNIEVFKMYFSNAEFIKRYEAFFKNWCDKYNC